MRSPLYKQVIRLAYEHLDLREYLLPIIAGGRKAAMSKHVDDVLSDLLVGDGLNHHAVQVLVQEASLANEREVLLGIKCWSNENKDIRSTGTALHTIRRAERDVGLLPVVPVNRLQDEAAHIAELLDRVFAD